MYVCGVTTCVDYDDILALTLYRNMQHLQRCVVVTSHEDVRTAEVVRSVPGVQLLQTDAFTRNGMCFNKGLALEEGFDLLGRSGWLLSWDADILFPTKFELGPLDPNMLYGVPRRQLPPGVTNLEGDWKHWPLKRERPCIGYFQLFHADAKPLQSRPWYPTDRSHAASDWDIVLSFAGNHQVLPHPVLHIGQNLENWFGRVTPRLDGTLMPDVNRKRVQMGELRLSQNWPCSHELRALVMAARATGLREKAAKVLAARAEAVSAAATKAAEVIATREAKQEAKQGETDGRRRVYTPVGRS